MASKFPGEAGDEEGEPIPVGPAKEMYLPTFIGFEEGAGGISNDTLFYFATDFLAESRNCKKWVILAEQPS